MKELEKIMSYKDVSREIKATITHTTAFPITMYELEKVMNLQLLYFVHVTEKQDSLQRTIMLGNSKDNMKRGRANKRWSDSTKEVKG